MSNDPLEIARAWATPGYCRSCLREQATDADWGHEGGCECARCRSVCWEAGWCGDERGGIDPSATVGAALIAKHAEVGRLREALDIVAVHAEQGSASPYIGKIARAALAQEAGK